jgi:copper(I)-binding protein
VKTRRLAPAVLAAATVLSLTACGANRSALTYQERDQGSSVEASADQLALRGVSVAAPESDEGYEVGDDAVVQITVTNSSTEDDRLVEVTSSAAREVAVLALGQERDMVVPALGSTGSAVTLELRGLTRPLRPGEYVDLSFRFADNGTVELAAPVSPTGETDRAVYTGERFEGGEEPALQAPAGGHSEEEGEH